MSQELRLVRDQIIAAERISAAEFDRLSAELREHLQQPGTLPGCDPATSIMRTAGTVQDQEAAGPTPDQIRKHATQAQ